MSMAISPAATIHTAYRRRQAIVAPTAATPTNTAATGAKAVRAPPARLMTARQAAVRRPTGRNRVCTHPTQPTTARARRIRAAR